MVAELNEAERQPVLARWTRTAFDPTARAAAARALMRLQNHPEWQPLADLLADFEVAVDVREALAGALVSGENSEIAAQVIRLFSVLPQPRQEQLARQLVSHSVGAALLLEMTERGQATGRLLQRPAIREPIVASSLPNAADRVDRILASIPAEPDALEAQLRAAGERYLAHPGSVERGRQVFVKHCQSCHQVQGQGALVGPQLDGIGQRGLQRVIEDVLAPYRNVDASFRTTVLALHDGRVIGGLVRQREGDAWTVVDAMGKVLTIDRTLIESERTSNASIMPDNFATVLSDDDRNDLWAFLVSLRDK
jgi:putative heme-binding domain-containing protein